MRLLISGGGTGGHVYPALSVTQELHPQNDELLWIGGIGGMERSLVERASIPYTEIETGQLRGINPLRALGNITRMILGVRQSLQIIKEFQPNVCFVTGGYVCAPVVIACRMRKIPVVIYLPDMKPGWAIQGLSKLAQRVAISFPEVASYFGGLYPQGKGVVTGYPVRAALVEAAKDRQGARQALAETLDMPSLSTDMASVVLVFGGSRGARSINQAIWSNLLGLVDHAHILHVIGERDWPIYEAQADTLAGASSERYHPVAYLHDEMTLALAAANLSVARAGASTLGEFPVAQLPSILVPLPFAGVNQMENAQALTAHGAAILLLDENLETDLLPMLVDCLTDEHQRSQMEAVLRELAKPEAALNIAELLKSVIV
ncbi:MAG: UDP-N-acetylglucosamine--N-acetylmuramyl-(pentapeptide) pyrophosphoryl-undecaprenol N-acetylglucosamine transferase [Chloroflexota bacterium]